MPVVLDKPELTDKSPPSAARVPHGLPRPVAPRELAATGLAAVLNDLFGPRERRAFGILMYHRVVNPPPDQPARTWNVPPALFEKQLTGLLDRGWRPLPLRHVLECVERHLPLPRKTFVITFDDGYVNTLTQALPVLTRMQAPATVFLSTAYLDSTRPFPSDDWPAAGRPGVPSEAWRPLTSEECRRLTGNGLIELGAHTHTHADFRFQPNAFLADLEKNLAVLRDRFGVQRPAFAFPYGSKSDGFANANLASAAREAGVLCSLTTEATIVRPDDSPFDWGRFAAADHDTARTLAAKLGGWQEAVRMVGRKVRDSVVDD